MKRRENTISKHYLCHMMLNKASSYNLNYSRYLYTAESILWQGVFFRPLQRQSSGKQLLCAHFLRPWKALKEIHAMIIPGWFLANFILQSFQHLTGLSTIPHKWYHNLHVFAPFGAKLTRAAILSPFWSLVLFLEVVSWDVVSTLPVPPE